MQKINRGTIFPLYPDLNTVSMAANIVILEWMEQSQTPSAWFLKLIAKSTMKEHRQKSCFILTLLGKTSLHQLERLQCSEWCRELNNQADTLTECHLIRQEEAVPNSERKTFRGTSITSHINFLFLYSHLLWPLQPLPMSSSGMHESLLCWVEGALGAWPCVPRMLQSCMGSAHCSTVVK